MSTAELQWVESNGGPLLILPSTLLGAWEGADTPEPHRTVQATSRWNTDGPATDYDRACDVREWLGPIVVGTGEGLVLAGEPLAAAWQPPVHDDGGLLVRWQYAASDAAVARWLTELPAELPWRWSARYQFDAGPLVLFDAAEPGLDPTGLRLELPLTGGRYDIHTVHWQPDSATSLLLHRFTWSEAAT